MSTAGTYEQSVELIQLELQSIKAGNSEGMIPVYAILGELIEALDEGDEKSSTIKIQKKLEEYLDQAKDFDEEMIALLNTIGQLSSTPEADVNEFAASDVSIQIGADKDREILCEFQSEALEHLEQIESSLLKLEQKSDDMDSINDLFRSFHTIKGVSGFLGFRSIKDLTHEVESLLDLARKGELSINSSIITVILASKDATQKLMDQIAEAMTSGSASGEIVKVSGLMKQLKDLAAGKDIDTQNTKAPSIKESISKKSIRTEQQEIKKQEAVSIRVNASKMDHLLENIGELICLQNQLEESLEQDNSKSDRVKKNIEQLKRISKELQETSLHLRMVPIKGCFQKATRVARDLGHELQKQVQIEVEGEDIELDRNLIELINDPLLHLVRNCMDHGVETLDERIGAGKSDIGTIKIKAQQIGNSAIITISDDGKGIDTESILKKAVEKHLVDPRAENTEDEILQLIFHPGLSTATRVTAISGRGVGMDVVRQNIEKLRGTIKVSSKKGRGSTFRIQVPLTMSIIDALIIQSGSEQFILPACSINTALEHRPQEINKLGGTQSVLNFRDTSIPVFNLNEILSVNSNSNSANSIVLVTENLEHRYGLIIDKVISRQEVVIKSLNNNITKNNAVSGCAILGDGRVRLILDPDRLYQNSSKN